MLRSLFPVTALLLASCSTPRSAPEIAPPALFEGAVSSAEPRATAAGEAMLAKGGSATDAALAVLVALTVVEPQSSGIGGGGFMVRSDLSGNVVTYDGRETAPAAAGPDWFLGEDGEPLPFSSVVPGGRSVGVPGNVALMALAHEEHGRLAWAELFEPAIRLARGGFPMTKRLHDMLERETDELLGDAGGVASVDAASRAIFYGPDGKPWPVGTMLRNPVLADTLEAIAAGGREAFYRGPNAAGIATRVSRAPIAPAPMTIADLAAYEAKERAPVCGAYRGHRVCSMGPPSSGATTLLQILGMLERFDLAALGPDSPDFWHLFAEATRLAFADRGAYLGDSDFVDVPVAGMIDPAYLRMRGRLINPEAAMAQAPVGNPEGARAMAMHVGPVEQGTSHFAVADAYGNVVSLTSTIEGPFGSGLMVGGYFLNNEMTDFSFAPVGEDGRPVANAVAAGKRPRSSMSPAIVFAKDGSPWLGVGAAGGPTIITQTAKNIIAAVDFGMGMQAAIALPNVYAPGNVLFVEQAEGAEALAAALRAKGHENVRVIPSRFKANAVERVGDRWVAAFDPRTQKDVTGEGAR
ncbi:gamma-glutamyltransferase [Sphingomicrobium arenosum]|uniref:gamma-glutamyltransferase n=1 Tax=Sphingomicrobium arenosum TaxID=2233861 RepID=UPI002240F697|nr:gamma-glutamyltransferase [Sphingomicrobium arenosum]